MSTQKQSRIGALGSKLKGAFGKVGKIIQSEAALHGAAQQALRAELATSNLAPEVQAALHLAVRRVEQVKPRVEHARAMADLTRAAFPKDTARRNAKAALFVEKHSSLSIARAVLLEETASPEGDELVTAQPTMTGPARAAWPKPEEVYARANRRGGK